MKAGCWLLFLPFAPLFTAHGEAPRKSVSVLVQIYETDAGSALEVLDLKDDAKALAHVRSRQCEGKASLVECVYVRAASGDRLRIESVLERLFGTEGDPPEIPSQVTLVDAKPPHLEPTHSTFTAFETDYEGLRIEIDPVAGDGESQVIDLNTTIQWSVLKEKVSLAADSEARQQKPLADKWHPLFTVTDIDESQTTQRSGEIVLLHAAPSPQKSEKTAIVFLTAWILK